MHLLIDALTSKETGVIKSKSEIKGIGHRVVQGGETFRCATLIDAGVKQAIEENNNLAPLHNPANLTGIRVAEELFPGTPNVAVFDTEFHQTMPPKAFIYALPYSFYEDLKIRRYGFHGTSHKYVAINGAKAMGHKVEELNLITIHLGNGGSISAVEKGKCIDTSMGMTPLAGIMMGSRCGDIDPAIVNFIAQAKNIDCQEVDAILNNESGLKGICGMNDMRDIHDRVAEGDKLAKLAVEMFTYQVKKYIGAYFAAMGSVDAILFTAGIGENDDIVRQGACSNMLGFERDYPTAHGVLMKKHNTMPKDGDSVLVPAPAFPIHVYAAVIAGASVIRLSLYSEESFLGQIQSICQALYPRPKLVMLNYPHNPTGVLASKDFFAEVIRLAKKYDFMVINDFAYSRITYDGYVAPSLLEVEGAKDVAVEFGSFSKSYNMAGWRLGYCVGNRHIIEGLSKIKGYYDYGIFSAIQVAGIVAMRDCEDDIGEQVKLYQQRRDALCEGLERMGWEVERPKAGMFLWVKIPEPFSFMGSIRFAVEMMDRANVAVAPGAGFGQEGEGYLRLALVENENRIRQALKQMKKCLSEIEREMAEGSFSREQGHH
ncbi:unnamed protein product [Cyprideis torosa]|uniref:Probable acetate kinase n=1 Tax=Cyprideis torosa TaxID=163714 RepID=A0A7R8WPT7_9CRUS|nr:unnamed protein product [Cyprideis torosa]CAG0901124.1 unnamed protein product [Cyprideis torosa]